MRWMLLILASLALLTASPGAEPLMRVQVTTPAAQTWAARLLDEGFDVLEGEVTATTIDLIVTRDDRARLESHGFTLRTIGIGRPLRELAEEGPGDPLPTGYEDYAAIVQGMAAVAAAYPDICQLVDLTERYGQPPTHEGRHLYALKISDQAAVEEDEPAVLIVSCHHAREVVTPVLAQYAIEQLTSGYGLDPDITEIVDSHQIWIAPVWNPDGYDHVYYYDNYWRKNRRPVSGGVGIDLNRNYPFGWYNPCSGSNDPGSAIYKGPSPASEVETQTMIALSEDQRFAQVIDYHSSGREVLSGYDCWSHPFDTYWRNKAVALSQASGYGGNARGPSADGEHYQWQWATLGAHAHLIETATEFQPSYAAAQQEAALVWPGMVWMMRHPIPLWGHVTDSMIGGPVAAQIVLENVSMPNGEVNSSGGTFGRYHVTAPAGVYDVRFEADGYDPILISDVLIEEGQSLCLDVDFADPMSVASAPAQEAPRLLAAGLMARGSRVAYVLPQASMASLGIYDVSGARVCQLRSWEPHPTGRHEVIWRGTDDGGRRLGAGSYFLRLRTDRQAAVQKVILIQ